MGLESLINNVDNKILQGCNSIVKKANEQIGCNKYDLARVCDWGGAASMWYASLGYVALWQKTLVKPFFGLALAYGCQGFLQAGVYAIRRNNEMEKLEEWASENGTIPSQFLVYSNSDKYRRMIDLTAAVSLCVALPFLPLGEYPGLDMLCAKGLIGYFSGCSLAAYFRSCDYQQRQKGKIFEALESQEPAAQEVKVKK